jgi:hypothetical protein
MKLPTILALILFALDAASTIYGIHSGKASEGNGLLKKVMDRIGVVPAVLLSRVPFLAALYFLNVPDWSLWAIVGMCALVVANNARVLLK